MDAVVYRKNLGKCVISPLTEHSRKAILLFPPSSTPCPPPSTGDSAGLLPLPSLPPPPLDPSLMSPSHYGVSIYQTRNCKGRLLCDENL